jgi:hypothetical protein
MANETPNSYKAIAVPTRMLLHPNEPVRDGGDALRAAAGTATSMRRSSTQGQTWRDAKDVNLTANPADLRVDTYIATTEGVSSTLAMREDGLMLLAALDEATAGLLCTLAKAVPTTFSIAPIPMDVPATGSLMREPKEEIIGKMKKGPFLDSYYWTNVAHVNDAPDVVKRFKIKTGEIAPDADKKADAKAKKAAATKDREKEAST